MFDIYDLFESVGIIIDAKLKELSLDRTILCTVVDKPENTQGIYKVSYEGTVFNANSTISSLEIDDLVYVGVPQGDYSNAYIISKKITNTVLQSSMKMSFQNFIKELNPISLGMTKEGQNKITLESLNNSSHSLFNAIQASRLGIRAIVSVDPNEKIDLTKCGIRLHIASKETIENQIFTHFHTIDLNFNNLISPTASSDIGQVIEEVLDISTIKNMESIKFECYSDNDLFKIFLQDFQIFLGNDKQYYTVEGLTLYTDSNKTYNAQSNQQRTLYARFVYKEDNEIQIITPYTPSTAIPKNIKLEWEQAKEQTNNWTIQTNKALNIYKSQEKYQATITYNSIESDKVEKYQGSLTFVNEEENIKLLKPASTNTYLTSNTVNFNNIYNPDGSIIDYALISDPINYNLYFSSSPFVKNEYVQGLKFKIVISIPKSNSNLSLLPNDNKSFVLNETEDQIIYEYVETLTEDKKLPDIKLMSYIIKEFYIPSNIHNTIICTLSFLDGNEILDSEQYSLNIEFSRSGITKSDYTLWFDITDDTGKNVRYIKAPAGSFVNVVAKLYDASGNEVEITRPVEWQWHERNSENEAPISIVRLANNSISLISNIQNINNINEALILEGTYSIYKEDVQFARVKGLIPIAINNNPKEIQYLQGPTIINYDSSGGNPSFYQTPYQLYDKDKNKINDITWTDNRNKGSATIEEDNVTLYPRLQQLDGKYQLYAPKMYIKNSNANTIFIAKSGGETVWIQPILSYQIKSFSSIVNDWDGRSIVTKKDASGKQYMMTPMLGAGSKDSEGRFSGVLLGEVANEDGSTPMTGIYGYGQNEQSYALKEDGSAFFGKSGEGRINFHGDLGLIYSGNFDGTFYNIDTEYIWQNLIENVERINNENGNMSSPYYTWEINSSQINYIEIVGKVENYIGQGEKEENQFDTTIAINAKDTPFELGTYIFEETISIENLSFSSNDNYDQTSELCLYLDNYNNFKYYSTETQLTSFDQQQITYLSIGTSGHATNTKIRMYNGGKFNIKVQIKIENDNQGLQIPLLNILTICGETKQLSGRQFRFKIDNLKLYKLNEEVKEFVASDIAMNKNINKIRIKDTGTQGTFLSLKEGEFITNNSVFRGKIQVESMELLNEIVIGDPTGGNGPWIRITPDGRFLTSDTGKAFSLNWITSGSTDSNIHTIEDAIGQGHFSSNLKNMGDITYLVSSGYNYMGLKVSDGIVLWQANSAGYFADSN